MLYGNAYVEAATLDGALREFYALRPDRMSVVPGRTGWPAGYVYRAGADETRYDLRGEGLEPILHLRLFNPFDDYYGLAPLAAAQLALDTHNAASFWNKALLDNSARPSGALVYARPDGAHLTDEQFTRLKEELEENFSGALNAGRPLLLEGGLDWKALSLSPKDMDFSQTRDGAAREIALAFGVPPLLLGLPGDNTYSNFQEANRAFWRQSVIPLVGRLQKSFAAWLTPAYGPLRLAANLDSIDALAEERALEWRRIDAAGFLTLDEQRAAAGYGPAPEGFAAKGRQAHDGDALELRYRPDQPRAPAGQSDGGRWVAEGGGGSGVARNAGNGTRRESVGRNGSGIGGGLIDSARIAALLGGAPADATQGILIAGNDDPKVRNDAGGLIHQVGNKEPFAAKKYPVDLAEEEAQGSHSIARHISRSTQKLIERANRNRIGFRNRGAWEDRIGSFTSLLAANYFVNATIEQNIETIDQKVIGGNRYAIIKAWYDRPTGYESYRRRLQDPAVIRTTYGVAVLLRPDKSSKNGFRIVTAFPINK